MQGFSKDNPFRVAIIGSGPAGFYAAEHLFKKSIFDIKIDMFDRLPTPFGLVRTGVAPDHQKIKSVTKVFDKIASNPGFNFYGLVEYGKHLTLGDLKNYYNQIVFATGAQTDRKMKIPGEDFSGSHSATDFVAWYNGHPDYKDYEFDLSHERAVVVGVGNVAIDVARILCLSENELLQTDIADYAMDALLGSNVKEVHVLGRRGPVQAAFTNPEIKELGKLEDADVIVRADELELDEFSSKIMNEERSVQKKMEILSGYAERNGSEKRKKLKFRFLISPTKILGDDSNSVSGIRLVKNELYKNESGSVRPRPTGVTEELDIGLVFRSIGYQGVPLPEVPFDSNSGVISNDHGRVTDNESGTNIKGLYTTGWIKRGPTGVIGTNKSDSLETVECMIEDMEKGEYLDPDKCEIINIIRDRQPDFVTYDDWSLLDEIEVSRGKNAGRPRVKFYDVSRMLGIVNEKQKKAL